MFNNLLLCDDYKYTFTAILLKFGFLKVPKELECLGVDFLINGGVRKFGEKKFSDMILSVYQMSMLYDEFILIEESEDFFDIAKNNFMPSKIIISDEDISFVDQEREYFIEYIEPILKNNIKDFDDFIKRYFSLVNINITEVKDAILNDILNNKLERLYKMYPGIEWAEWSIKIFCIIKDIQNMHEMSAINDCPLLSMKFDFRETHAECKDLENYALIRVEYKNIIGALPTINNAYEILKIKKHKKKEIRAFKEVFSEFEANVKNDGNEKAIRKISSDMRKVSIDLAKGSIASKVANWASVLLVPVTVAQTLLELPPIGLGVNVIAWISSRYISKKDSYKKWTEIIR